MSLLISHTQTALSLFIATRVPQASFPLFVVSLARLLAQFTAMRFPFYAGTQTNTAVEFARAFQVSRNTTGLDVLMQYFKHKCLRAAWYNAVMLCRQRGFSPFGMDADKLSQFY